MPASHVDGGWLVCPQPHCEWTLPEQLFFACTLATAYGVIQDGILDVREPVLDSPQRCPRCGHTAPFRDYWPRED